MVRPPSSAPSEPPLLSRRLDRVDRRVLPRFLIHSLNSSLSNPSSSSYPPASSSFGRSTLSDPTSAIPGCLDGLPWPLLIDPPSCAPSLPCEESGTGGSIRSPGLFPGSATTANEKHSAASLFHHDWQARSPAQERALSPCRCHWQLWSRVQSVHQFPHAPNFMLTKALISNSKSFWYPFSVSDHLPSLMTR